MSAFESVRRAIEDSRPKAKDSFGEFAHGSLIAAFNRLALEANQAPSLGSVADFSLEVRPERTLDTRRSNDVLSHLGSAVAALGREVVGATSKTRGTRLTAADYDRAPLYPEIAGGRLLVVRPTASMSLPGSTWRGLSTGQVALTRLVNLLPASRSDSAVVNDYPAAQVTSRKAMSEIAAAVNRVGDLEFVLRGGMDDVRAVVDRPIARRIHEELDAQRFVTETLTVEGVLDGARVSRRTFYLEMSGNLPDLHGLIDEPLVGDVVNQLRRPVMATLERTVAISGAGRRGRPAYRLIKLEKPNSLFD